jgi:FGGY-family pentulose kinase
MEQHYFLGVDVGSASVRAGLFDKQGQRMAFAVRPIKQFHSHGDWVEQSSADIWTQVCQAVRESVAVAGIDPVQVRSIGFDATCSLVAVGADGQPISQAASGEDERDIIMWMDHRATEEAREINLTNDEALQYVGGEVSVEMELPKVLWLKRRFPERYANVWRFFDLADYLVWRSTNADVASVCTLTCKWNYLAHQQQFSHTLLQAVDLAELPQKVPATVLNLGEKAGYLSADAARELGLSAETAVAAGIIDAHAGGLALVGEAPEGRLALISGTSNCHMIVNPRPMMVPGVWGPYFSAMIPDLWLSEGGQSAAGSLVEWAIRQSDAWPELQQQAERQQVSYYTLLNQRVAELEQQQPYPTRHLHILADHHGNRSPRANPEARGMESGLTLEQGMDALARRYLAALQAIAYGTRHIIDVMTESGHQINTLIVCGGATKNPLWLREYANITGRDILLAEEEDAVTLGAALLGATACGAFSSLAQAAGAMVRLGALLPADPTHADFHQAKYRVYLRMYQDQQDYNQIMQN